MNVDDLVQEVNFESDQEDDILIVDSNCDSDSEESDANSDSGSLFGSLNGDDPSKGVNRDEDFDNELDECEDDDTIAKSNSNSVTIQINQNDDNTDEDENDLIESINDKLQIQDPKSKSEYYLKQSQALLEPSEDTQFEVRKVLSGKKNPTECDLCGKFFEGEFGLKLHKKKTH